MTKTVQLIMIEQLFPPEACQNLEPQSHSIALASGEPGIGDLTFAFTIARSQFYGVMDFSHDDSLDPDVAVASMRATIRNLVNWILLGQAVKNSARITIASDQLMARYKDTNAWTVHLPAKEELTDSLRQGSDEAISAGMTWLPFLMDDRKLLYAFQDFADSLNYKDATCLFFLWRAVEWILLEFHTPQKGKSPAYNPATKELGLPDKWIVEIGQLAHNYVRHARYRDQPETHWVDAARDRVRMLVITYTYYKFCKQSNQPFVSAIPPKDHLTDWAPPDSA